MRAIIDTNVLLSGLLWHGTPHALLDRVRDGTVTLISSPVLLAELAEVLEQPKFEAVLVLLDLNPFQNIPILAPTEALRRIEAQK